MASTKICLAIIRHSRKKRNKHKLFRLQSKEIRLKNLSMNDLEDIPDEKLENLLKYLKKK